MPDYGHDLSFGTFITPQNQRSDDVVALAQFTERAGLDLATFQDHPYQPAFLDTWTLMSGVAAQTDTLRVAPNVLNLPLRQPAVLARSAASLDLLSGGRVELGLGAGAFWEGIVAKRGPEPAHDIGLWLGAYKPRMLRLTGRKADGWLPSLSYMPLEDLAAANRTIDEAATGAGRDPREIRRLLNIEGTFGGGDGFLQGAPEQWVQDLLPLVAEHGFSAFIVMGDDARTIQAFGQEVAPALREAVARARAEAGTETGPARSPKALALRAGGIDYDAIPAELAPTAVEPGDGSYGKVRSTCIRSGSPGLVLRPADVGGVQAALAYARAQDVPLSVRSGGHGISGRSTNNGG